MLIFPEGSIFTIFMLYENTSNIYIFSNLHRVYDIKLNGIAKFEHYKLTYLDDLKKFSPCENYALYSIFK